MRLMKKLASRAITMTRLDLFKRRLRSEFLTQLFNLFSAHFASSIRVGPPEMNRITISRAVFAFGMLTLAGLIAVIVASNYALSQLKVGGPIYNKIKLGNDLVADILPPPEYVIEAYLEATLALHDPASAPAHRERLVQLKKDYDDRRDYWTKSDLTPAIRTMLVEKSDAEVQKF